MSRRWGQLTTKRVTVVGLRAIVRQQFRDGWEWCLQHGVNPDRVRVHIIVAWTVPDVDGLPPLEPPGRDWAGL